MHTLRSSSTDVAKRCCTRVLAPSRDQPFDRASAAVAHTMHRRRHAVACWACHAWQPAEGIASAALTRATCIPRHAHTCAPGAARRAQRCPRRWLPATRATRGAPPAPSHTPHRHRHQRAAQVPRGRGSQAHAAAAPATMHAHTIPPCSTSRQSQSPATTRAHCSLHRGRLTEPCASPEKPRWGMDGLACPPPAHLPPGVQRALLGAAYDVLLLPRRRLQQRRLQLGLAPLQQRCAVQQNKGLESLVLSPTIDGHFRGSSQVTSNHPSAAPAALHMHAIGDALQSCTCSLDSFDACMHTAALDVCMQPQPWHASVLKSTLKANLTAGGGLNSARRPYLIYPVLRHSGTWVPCDAAQSLAQSSARVAGHGARTDGGVEVHRAQRAPVQQPRAPVGAPGPHAVVRLHLRAWAGSAGAQPQPWAARVWHAAAHDAWA